MYIYIYTSYPIKPHEFHSEPSCYPRFRRKRFSFDGHRLLCRTSNPGVLRTCRSLGPSGTIGTPGFLMGKTLEKHGKHWKNLGKHGKMLGFGGFPGKHAKDYGKSPLK